MGTLKNETNAFHCYKKSVLFSILGLPI